MLFSVDFIFDGIVVGIESEVNRATSFPRRSVTAIKLRKKLPLLLERVGVRRIKIRKIALFNPLILTFSRREKELSILNLMAVRRSVGTMQRAKRLSIKTWAEA